MNLKPLSWLRFGRSQWQEKVLPMVTERNAEAIATTLREYASRANHLSTIIEQKYGLREQAGGVEAHHQTQYAAIPPDARVVAGVGGSGLLAPNGFDQDQAAE